MSPFSLSHAALTDRGQVRSRNEDAVRAEGDERLFVVADGMGGHPAGDVASALAVEVVFGHLEGLDDGVDPAGAGEALREAVAEAGRRILEEERRDPERRGMGTTLTALLVRDDRWAMGHVGDSRGYLYRDGEMRQVTVDHTVFPGSSTLTRALGAGDEAEADLYDGELRDGDLFLLCSDGLTKVFDDDELAERLGGVDGSAEGLEAASRDIVEEANRRGAPDNVTVALVRAREG